MLKACRFPDFCGIVNCGTLDRIFALSLKYTVVLVSRHFKLTLNAIGL